MLTPALAKNFYSDLAFGELILFDTVKENENVSKVNLLVSDEDKAKSDQKRQQMNNVLKQMEGMNPLDANYQKMWLKYERLSNEATELIEKKKSIGSIEFLLIPSTDSMVIEFKTTQGQSKKFTYTKGQMIDKFEGTTYAKELFQELSPKNRI